MDTLSLHPQLGAPIMHHDQFDSIATYLFQIKEDDEISTLVHQTHMSKSWPSVYALNFKKARKLTRRVLKSQNDWYEWQQSEYKHHQQDNDQHMFGNPQPIPSGTNHLPLYGLML